MIGDTNTPRRRKMPILGMTTVGLAVSAGSLGLYRGAAAVPLAPPDQPTWTTAEVRVPPVRPAEEPIVQASAQEPAPPTPTVPALPAVAELPPPAKLPPVPTPWPPPRPIEVTPAPAPVMPVSPAGPLMPALPSLAVPDIATPVVVPAVPAKPVESEVAPPPRALPEPVIVTPMPVAPVSQPVQIAPSMRPIVPASPDFLLPLPQPGFNVNETVAEPSVKTAPGALTSLTTEPPGAAPMTPAVKALKSAALGVALAAAPLHAAETPAKAPATADTAKDVVADLKKELKKLRDDVELEKNFRALTDDTVNGKLDKETNKTEPGLVTKFNELDARLKRMEESLKKVDVSKFEETVARLEKKLDEMSKTTALKPSAADGTPKAMPGGTGGTGSSPTIVGAKSTVRIINEYAVAIAMKINGTSYRVEPNNERSVEIPAGSYSYELLQAGSDATTATIRENELVKLRIK